MQNYYDYKKYFILYVDDEEKSLKYLTKAFEDTFRFLTAPNAEEGYRLLENHRDEVGILLTDQRMPGETGVQLLEKSRHIAPRLVRILVTAYTDLDATIAAVNSGAIYKYISKPWEMPELEMTLRRGLEFFTVQKERDHLLKEKLSVLHNMMIKDRVISLGILASGLGHHVRNSLVAVKTYLDLAPSKLKDEVLDMEELRNPNYWLDFYNHVQSQVQRITDMLKNVGLISEYQPIQFSDKLVIQDILQTVLEKLDKQAQSKDISIVNLLPDDLKPLIADGKYFQNFLELLLGDIINTLETGRQITLSAEVIDSKESNEPGGIRMMVEDNGNGLPEESLRSIFDPFYLRKDSPQDFGISLMACYLIVFHHGGTFSAENRKEGGTRFIAEFPFNPQDRTPETSQAQLLAKILLNETLWEKLLSSE